MKHLIDLVRPYRRHVLLCLVSAVFILLFSLSASPLYAFYGFDEGIFKIIGYGILQGRTPYADLFDHKGPLLFYIYALCCAISTSKWGLFLVETLFMWATLECVYSLTRMFLSRVKACVAVSLSLMFLAASMYGGGQCEFFELPFIAASLLGVVRYYAQSSDSGPLGIPRPCDTRCLGVCLGVCLACVFLIRINDAVTQVFPLIASVCLSMLLEREYKRCLAAVAWGLLGFCVVCLPFLLYFLYKGIIADVWYGMFTFNLLYLDVAGWKSYTLKILVFAFLGILALLSWHRGSIRDNKQLVFVVLPVLVFSAVFIGNRSSVHYYIVLAPMFALLVSLVYNKFTVAFCLWVLCVSGWSIGVYRPQKFGPFFSQIYFNAYCIKANPEQREVISGFKDLVGAVPPQERDSIWFHTFGLLELAAEGNIIPCNRFFVPSHRACDPKAIEENFMASRPLWVLTTEYIEEEELDFLSTHYRLTGTAGKGGFIRLYRLK